MKIALVVAVAENGTIGVDGDIPWHHPEDLAHFKETTVGHPVIMGRRTYESIVDRLGGPLPDRLNIVLSSRSLDLPSGARRAAEVSQSLDIAAETGSAVVYVVGGRSVYEAFLPLADRLLYTEIHDAYEGDTSFPDWDRSAWRELEREDREDLSFVVYERRESF
jgi:dihydrofolate reductase